MVKKIKKNDLWMLVAVLIVAVIAMVVIVKAKPEDPICVPEIDTVDATVIEPEAEYTPVAKQVDPPEEAPRTNLKMSQFEIPASDNPSDCILRVFEYPVTEFLAMSVPELEDELGQPVDIDGFSYMYPVVEVDVPDTTITGFSTWNPYILSAHGYSLQTNRDGLIELLGKPDDEGPNDPFDWWMVYTLEDTYCVVFRLDGINGDIWLVRVTVVSNTEEG